MGGISFLDLPNEIIQVYIFKYLEDVDIYTLGKTDSTRLKEICENTVQIGKLKTSMY